MNAIAALLDGPFAAALGRALVHLVWQASLVALLLAGTLAFMRRASANARYAVSCAALALTMALPVATAFVSYEPEVRIAPPAAQTSPGYVERAGTPPMSGNAGALGALASLPLDPALPWIVGFWLAGVTLLSARIGVALVSARRLADSGIDTLPREWNGAFRRLVDAMGVERAVRLLESTRVDVPTVVGWLRPVILVPASALTGLTPLQLETVLAHELAHIRRHDFLVNLAQTVVETLFFYHPAVWWISNRVRVEREHCCDDVAVATCGDALGYARALATLEELRSARVPATALAATGGSLLERVRRLVGLGSDDLGSTRPIAALIALSIVTAAIAVPFSARAGRAENLSGTTITVDAARTTDEVAGIWVEGAAPAEIAATPDPTDADAFDGVFGTAELAAATIELHRAEIDRQLAVIDSRRDEIDRAVSAARASQLVAIDRQRTAIERAMSVALSAREMVDAEIATILAVAPPAPPPPPARPATPAPRARLGWTSVPTEPTPPVAPTAPVAPVIAVTPEVPPIPVVSPAPVAPAAPSVMPAPVPALAPLRGGLTGTGKPVDPDNPSIDDLVFLHGVGVDAAYIRSMQNAGLRDLNARQLAMLRSVGVDSRYVTSMESSLGAKLGWSQLVRLRALGVDESDIAKLRAKGTKIDLDSLMRLNSPAIDRAELERMRAELQRSRAELEAARRQAFEVDKEYVAELESAGLKGLSRHEYEALRSTGVDGAWVKEIRAAGYSNFNASELAGLHATGIDGDYLRRLRAAGFNDLSASQLMRLRAAGIDADDLKQWKKK